MTPIEITFRPPRHLFNEGLDGLRSLLDASERAGIDGVTVGDHVAFHGGQGFDGLIQATALAMLSRTLTVSTSIYLLPLRHPVPVARQVASLASLAPGRFVFGVGIGGEDRHEVEICGVDPSTRGRRMDESIAIVRSLLGGETVTYHGQFFDIDDVTIAPAPVPPVPLLVGGRSAKALARTGRWGDGWIGIWVSPDRWAEAVATVEASAHEHGRNAARWHHRLVVWCGLDDDPSVARSLVSESMEQLYRIPFSKFERFVPAGPPALVAEALRPYVAAGCRHFTLLPIGRDPARMVDAVAAVKGHLTLD